MWTTIIIVKIISLHRKSSKVSEVKKSLATYAFIGEMINGAERPIKQSGKLEKVREKSWKREF